MFDTLQDRLAATFKSLRGKGRITEADIDDTAREIRRALLEADVNLAVVKDFVAAVKERARTAELHAALNPAQQIIKIVNDELIGILGGETRVIRFAKRPPTVIMLAGLQGAGKTTLAGKLALWLKGQGHSPLLVAADLQRPNAVNQLQIVGQRAGVHVYAPEPGNASTQGYREDQPSGDPIAVAQSSIAEAERRLYDVVIVDTAGRLGIDAELMQQAADIRNAVHPDEVLFVVDSMIGQDAVNTANAFAEGVGFDGVVLTKLDGDARGGAALSIARVTGKPIMFASNGEGLKDFDVFHPDRMASRILGMGDMLTLIEQAEKTFDADQSAKAAAKLTGQGGEFGLADFLQQMQMVRKMGPLSKIFGMLPGMGEMKDQLTNIDEKDVDRIEAIIHSMTPAERDNPKILDGSRRARIAKGSGVEVSQVNGLVNRFFEARKMMSAMATGKMAGMPGMSGMPGMGGGGGGGKR
ncbi:MAG: signal recognition particle protein, partial [Microlunatus sp.]|nr:signal recognition particle protein [Microlunatus sp.]